MSEAEKTLNEETLAVTVISREFGTSILLLRRGKFWARVEFEEDAEPGACWFDGERMVTGGTPPGEAVRAIRELLGLGQSRMARVGGGDD